MKRLVYTFMFTVLFLQETIIALYVKDKFIRPYGGDIMVEWLLYCFVRIIHPKKHKALPLYIFIFSVAIEFTQHLKLAEILGLGDNKLFCTIMGTSFSWTDIACYAVGCISIMVGQKMMRRNARRLTFPPTS